MNYQDIICYDFETTSVNPHRCQPTQLGAVAIHGRKLEIHSGSEFCSYIKPVFDLDECERLGLDPVTEEVLTKTHIKMEDLETAPSPKEVWGQFQQYVNKYNSRKGKWGAPVKAGMNIHHYDNIIIDRLAGGHIRNARKELDNLLSGGIIETEVGKALKKLKVGVEPGKLKLSDLLAREMRKLEPYGFGPWDDERQEETLFYPSGDLDLRDILWMWFENNTDVTGLGLDAMREYFSLETEGSHMADKDANDVALLLIKFLKLHRNFGPKVKFKGSCK